MGFNYIPTIDVSPSHQQINKHDLRIAHINNNKHAIITKEESREYISFVRIPAFHTTLHRRVLTNFQIGMLEYEDNVTTLLVDRNFGRGEIVRLRTTLPLKKDAFFSGYKFLSCDTCVVYGVKVTENCWFQGEGHRKDTAELLCDVIQDKTRQQILDWIPELESFISLCIPSFPWTTHSWSWGESLQ